MAEQKNWTEQDVLKILSMMNMMQVSSIEEEIIVDGDAIGELKDIIVDDGPSPYEIFERKDLSNRLAKYLNKLSPREQKVIQLRYGLNGGEPQTLDAIGQKYGVTRERIRQVEYRAIKKLRKYIIMRDGIININDF